jgi:hypothetical protein
VDQDGDGLDVNDCRGPAGEQGPPGQNGAKGERGNDGISGYQIVTGTVTAGAEPSTHEGAVQCPEGKIALGWSGGPLSDVLSAVITTAGAGANAHGELDVVVMSGGEGNRLVTLTLICAAAVSGPA